MAREAHPDRARALIEIGEHVERLGKIEGQRAARKLFPNVGKPTWESWCRLVRVGERAAVEQPAGIVIVATHPVTPVAPMAAGIEPSGLGFDRWIAEIDEINRALKDVAWPIDPETGRRGRVKNPMLLKVARDGFAQSAGLIVKHREAVFNQDRIEDFYQIIIEEVGKADRGVQHAVVARLREIRAYSAQDV
ncbi:hypothetical protein PQR64_33920 [Paraburkholderia phytofirmans]|uniref:hypothetical protein n=1 Tax=Paraburkholderia phytofirmans TaxID=261302 RepID=UPI0038BD5892